MDLKFQIRQRCRILADDTKLLFFAFSFCFSSMKSRELGTKLK